MDESHLDKKYFVDDTAYNCPYCNRNNVPYRVYGRTVFDWSENRPCIAYFVECNYCRKKSMHLSYTDLTAHPNIFFRHDVDLDDKIFYSVPTSFFTLDERIPRVIRELITEAEECLKMNLLTGASACMRKAVYEFTVKEDADGIHYEDKIKSLKDKFPAIDSTYFDILAHIQDMTSDKIHEQSWDKWDSNNLKLIIETLRNILHEIYVLPEMKKSRRAAIEQLRQQVQENKKPA